MLDKTFPGDTALNKLDSTFSGSVCKIRYSKDTGQALKTAETATSKNGNSAFLGDLRKKCLINTFTIYSPKIFAFNT